MSQHEKPNVSLSAVTVQNVGSLEVLNARVFPVKYPKPFYTDIVEKRLDTSRLIYFADVLVGAVCCKIEPVPESEDLRVYILTLGVLRPYRNLGIGKAALDYALEEVCARDQKIKSVRLHVQSSNDEAMSFYKKHGFESVESVPRYYPRLPDGDAQIMEKKL